MKVALVYDRVNKWGGAERILEQLHILFPHAPLYTAVYNSPTSSWADGYQVHPSFLNGIPFARTHHEWFAACTQFAFETFSFDTYDLVISITSSDAKAVITQPGTLHICYCLTPTRYLWSGHEQYLVTPAIDMPGGLARYVLRALTPFLRRWDLLASSRPDAYIAISERVARRVERYYHRSVSAIVYPPVNTEVFHKQKKNDAGGQTRELSGYYLTVSRLVSYKRIDILIDAFNRLGWPLVIIGDGRQRKDLQMRAKSNILFVSSYLTDEELLRYYQGCRAFVFAGDEDFGISAVEAQACGKPVYAYRESGLAESIIEGKTGYFFDRQTPEACVEILQSTHPEAIRPADCEAQAACFSEKRFRNEFMKHIHKLMAERKERV